MITEEPVELVTSREVTPLIETIRASLPLEQICNTEAVVTNPHYRIENTEQEAVVNGYMRDAATWTNQIATAWKPIKSLFDNLHDAACEAERDTAPAIGRIKTKCAELMKDWIERKRKAAAETQRQLDAATERDRLLKVQQSRESAFDGDFVRAESLLKEAGNLRSPVIMSQPVKLDGTAITPKFIGTVTDPMALIKAVAAGTIPLMHMMKGAERPLIVVDEVVLRQYVTKMGKQLNWPGVEVSEDIGFSPRKR